MPKENEEKLINENLEDASEIEAASINETDEIILQKEKQEKEVKDFNITSETVMVQPVQFASFEDQSQVHGEINKNLAILMNIKLQLTVELGRTELPIKKVLELTRGSIIELEKIAGEPVELYANGKLIANGEVVVIEDNFGLRVTSITEPEDILKGLKP
jgi:flagellar motor switch protein FliN/FliY